MNKTPSDFEAPQEMTPGELLRLIPQQFPFRFVDEITSVSETRIEGRYTFKRDEGFYAGHFPGNPVTPGVILLESMCQIGVVALGIYLLGLETSADEVSRWTTMFAEAETEFLKPVFPGETVTVRAERIFWRKKKLRCRIEMFNSSGALVAQACASGIGVKTHG